MFKPKCHCPRHVKRKHGNVHFPGEQLRQCSREEKRWIEKEFSVDERNKNRKWKICEPCRSRLEIEVKYKKLEVGRST